MNKLTLNHSNTICERKAEMKAGLSLEDLMREVTRQAKNRQDYVFSTSDLKLVTQQFIHRDESPSPSRMERDTLLHPLAQSSPHPSPHRITHPDSLPHPPTEARIVQTTTRASLHSSSIRPLPTTSIEQSSKEGSGFPEREHRQPLQTAVSTLNTPAGAFPLQHWMVEQIAGHAGLPIRYLRKLQQENTNLLDLNINTLLLQNPTPRLIRILDGHGRAFLSRRYRRLDNDTLLKILLPHLDELGGFEAASTEISPQKLYLKIISPRLRGEVRVGDEVAAGLVISNSEIGFGAVSIEYLIFRLVCTNGAIVPVNAGRTRRTHAGGVLPLSEIPQGSNRHRGAANNPTAWQLTLDETQETGEEKAWDMVREAVRESLHEEHFQEVLERMRVAANLPVETDAKTLAQRLGNRHGLHQSEQEAIEFRLLESGDFSLWGLTNAVTRTAQDVPSYERATQLERLGGSLLDVSPREWKVLALN